MNQVVDPESGLAFVELSHPWGMYTPIFPGYEEIKFERITYHAKHGVMTHKFITTFHTSTHVNAPIHLIPRAPAVGDIPLETFFGTGVVLSIPKRKWELIEPKDLEKATPKIRKDDIVLIDTGWHRKYSDSQEYFGHAPGLSKKAAEWLVKKGVKIVGVDSATIDHPLATSLGPHRNGPQIRYLLPEYKQATGREAIEDFPEWNPAHKILLAAGIPTIENVGGDLDDVAGKRCTFQGFPWKWLEGDACVIRLVALLDPNGNIRLEPGRKGKAADKPATQPLAAVKTGAKKTAALKAPTVISSTKDLEFYNLSHRWGHGMPEWPSRPLLNVKVLELHGRDGVFVQQLDGIMHRGTHMDAPLHVKENQPSITGYPIWRFFGTGVAVSIPKGKWGVITAKDLENAVPKIQKNDIVMINTGSHRNFADDPKYFAYSPGLYKEVGGMAGGEGREACRRRRTSARSSARYLSRAARPGAGAAAPRRRIQGAHRPQHHPGFPVLGAGAQDHDDQRHPRHREYRWRARQDHRQALHLLRLPVALATGRRLRPARGRGARPEAELSLRERAVTWCRAVARLFLHHCRA